jgi:hypothetical protein
MMTREELEKVIDEIKVDSDYPWMHKLDYILQNDQAQRAVIEQQAQEIAELRQYDARTIAVAKTTSSTVSNLLLAGPLTPQQIAVGKDVEIRRLAKQNQALREALQDILEIGKRDMTNPKYDGYFEKAKQLLNKV